MFSVGHRAMAVARGELKSGARGLSSKKSAGANKAAPTASGVTGIVGYSSVSVIA